MLLGLSTVAFIHSLLSLVALVAGVVVVAGLLGSRITPGWTGLFFVTAIATSATGFGLPSDGFGASQWTGVLSLVVLAVALLARYGFHLAGVWRRIYAVSLVIALYFLVLVLIAQVFKKVPALAAVAPTQSEPPFTVTQLVALVLFVVLAIAAARKFRTTPAVQ
jgi:hypothetical protein